MALKTQTVPVSLSLKVSKFILWGSDNTSLVVSIQVTWELDGTLLTTCFP